MKRFILFGRPLASRAVCKDCDGYTFGEWYQLRNRVWEEAWPGTGSKGVEVTLKHILCIGCVEKRLGRKLRRRDFDMRRTVNRLQPLSPKFKRAMPIPARMRDRLKRRSA
jgi:hypothetical protein